MQFSSCTGLLCPADHEQSLWLCAICFISGVWKTELLVLMDRLGRFDGVGDSSDPGGVRYASPASDMLLRPEAGAPKKALKERQRLGRRKRWLCGCCGSIDAYLGGRERAWTAEPQDECKNG